jgi:hypothetical protein
MPSALDVQDGVFACGLLETLRHSPPPLTFPRPSQAASSLETSTTETRAQATGLQMADDDTDIRALDRRVSAMYEFWSHVFELSALDPAGVPRRDSEALHFELPFEFVGDSHRVPRIPHRASQHQLDERQFYRRVWESPRLMDM